MLVLILGLAIFIGVHLVSTLPARAQMVARLGEGPYKIGYSVASLIGFALIVWGMTLARGSAADIRLWTPPVWTKHIAFALMLPAFILLAAAYIPSRIRDATKHPMLLAVKIWALAHLIANGDLAGLILFGSLLLWAGYDRVSLKKRGTRGPLGDRKGGPLNDVLAVVVGAALFAFMLFVGHKWLFGIPLLPGA
ncbi:MAG: NnrU family protein [Hyphomicrobiales bacterium]|nr:NnrU family protein [Hyphomicrobiales bacterium]